MPSIETRLAKLEAYLQQKKPKRPPVRVIHIYDGSEDSPPHPGDTWNAKIGAWEHILSLDSRFGGVPDDQEVEE